MWQDKVYLPPSAVELFNKGLTKEAFKYALLDSKRTTITPEELCSFDWYFRFKYLAGEHWIANDPFWRGKDAVRAKFETNGVLRRYCTDDSLLPFRDTEITWKFITRVVGTSPDPGQFIRVSVNGFRVPAYVVSRHTNWGFIMQSCWVVYTSFYMPRPGVCPELDDDTLNQSLLTFQETERVLFNLGLNLDNLEDI
eukprot:c4984_g1_i1.p1 GENE.c4984_g1_i1~~c4984_g1_i1.p1  ORF type:complete len:196 (+),score=21.68 c4984_g1_i1:207-794(+)